MIGKGQWDVLTPLGWPQWRTTYHTITSVWKMPPSWYWTGQSGGYWQQANVTMHWNGASRTMMMMMSKKCQVFLLTCCICTISSKSFERQRSLFMYASWLHVVAGSVATLRRVSERTGRQTWCYYGVWEGRWAGSKPFLSSCLTVCNTSAAGPPRWSS